MRKLLLASFVLFCVALPTMAAQEFDAKAEQAAAVKAEQAGDWDTALLHYENIYDSTPTTAKQQVELRHKFEELRPKVKPNEDPAKAGLYKVRVYIFRTTEIGKVKNTYTEKQIQDIHKAMAAYAKEIWTQTLGSLRVEYTIAVIDKPLTKRDGLPDYVNCMPYLTDLKPGEVDLVAAYGLSKGLPCNCWAATWGVVCKGAGFVGFNDGGDGKTADDGEVQIHEWLHSVQGAFEGLQNYPGGLGVNPDSGMKCGEGCWQPKEGKKGLYDWYRHIMTAHYTRKMWRGLTVLRPADNVWTAKLNLCPRFLAVGPFDIKDKDKNGLDTAYINEAKAKPLAGAVADGQGLFASGKKAWVESAITGRDLNFANLYNLNSQQAAYVATVVRSGKEQFGQVRVGSDDSCKVWQDGKVILADAAAHECILDQNIVNVKLHKGDNLFLLKVLNYGGDWTVNFRLTDAAGQPLPDMQYALPGQGK